MRCEQCKYYNKGKNCCEYLFGYGDAVVPGCIFIERYKKGECYLDFAFSATEFVGCPNAIALYRFQHLKYYGFESSIFMGMHSVLVGNCRCFKEVETLVCRSRHGLTAETGG